MGKSYIYDYKGNVSQVSNSEGNSFRVEYSAFHRYDGLNVSDCHDSCREEEGSGSPYARNACECLNKVFYAERELGIDCNLSRILYYYHPDYLGHNEYITDITGRPYPYFHYSAFGESLIEKNTNYGQFSSPYRFNGKELDPETGNYYYGARYYNPVWSVWLGVDPLALKNPDKTPYHFVSNNPINRIDPDGRDDFEINSKGEIVNRIKNKEADNFYMVDGDGNRIEGKSISLKYGTVESVRSQKAKYSKRNEDGSRESAVTNADIYKIRGDENGTQLFEFVADNTGVEWSHIKTGIEGDKGLNFLTTGHIEYTEPGATALLNGQLQYGYTIREMNHNHPGNTPVPSGVPGLTGEGGDIGFARSVTDWYQRKYPERSGLPTFNVYVPREKRYVPFSKNSKKSDFGY